MPQPYPDPSFNSTIGLFEYANTVTSSSTSPGAVAMFAMAIPLVVFLIMKARYYKTSDSLLVSFFIGFFLSSLLWAMHLLDQKYIGIFIALVILSAFWSYLDRD